MTPPAGSAAAERPDVELVGWLTRCSVTDVNFGLALGRASIADLEAAFERLGGRPGNTRRRGRIAAQLNRLGCPRCQRCAAACRPTSVRSIAACTACGRAQRSRATTTTPDAVASCGARP
jgi:hypothetical protein